MRFYAVEFNSNNELVEVKAKNKKEVIRILLSFGFNTKDIYSITELTY